MTLIKIISGGETGAGRGALEAAKELGLETGGWARMGYWTEEGPDMSLKEEFGLEEIVSTYYKERSRVNVRYSKGTALFGDMTREGNKLALLHCNNEIKRAIINPSADELRHWVDQFGIDVLFVTGDRESQNPGLHAKVKKLIAKAFGTPEQS